MVILSMHIILSLFGSDLDIISIRLLFAEGML